MKPQVEEYRRLTWNQQRRLLADYWEKQHRDAQATLDYAREEGREESRQALAEKDQTIAEQVQTIVEQKQTLVEKDRKIAELQRRLQDKEDRVP
jgi:hypothetical protein